MGFLNKMFGKTDTKEPDREMAVQIQAEPDMVYAPVTGGYIPLEKIPDEVFSQGILGKGCGIEPLDNRVTAPMDGIISTVAETKHAVGITAQNGAELLIHIGMDTVDMNGDGFSVKVQPGDKVLCGQVLMTFDMEKIRAANHPVTTAFVVANSDEYSEIFFDTDKRYEIGQKVGKITK